MPAEVRLVIEEDTRSLAGRLKIHDELAPPIDRGLEGPRPTLHLVAEIAPPVGPLLTGSEALNTRPDGPAPRVVPLEATSVVVRGELAVVGYHKSGEGYSGALDLISLADPLRPALVGHVRLTCTDVNAVDLRLDPGGMTGEILIAGSTCDPSVRYTAVVERIPVRGVTPNISAAQRAGLPGNAGTSVKEHHGRVYATSGLGGGLTVLNGSSWRRESFVDLGDARWVDVNDSTVAALAATGTGGAIHFFSPTLDPTGTMAIAWLTVPGAKSYLKLQEKMVYVAAGSAGVLALDLETGLVTGQLPVSPAGAPKNPDQATNALAIEGGWVLAANGADGAVLAARAPGPGGTMMALGRIRLSGSANHIASTSTLLFIAGGSAGARIFRHDLASARSSQGLPPRAEPISGP